MQPGDKVTYQDLEVKERNLNEKIIIDLGESIDLGLIIKYPSAIFYQNQTGGICCLYPEIEGVYVPLQNDEFSSPGHDLSSYFGEKYGDSGAIKLLDSDDADFIDSLFKNWQLDFLVVDREKLKDSHEAWIHVKVLSEPEYSQFTGLAPYPREGVVTWLNSD